MNSDTTTILIFITATFVAAGFVKGVVGMGLPTVAMGVLSLFMAPVAAASMLIIPSLVTNVWQLVAGPPLGYLFKRLATMMVMICLGTLLGISVLTGASSSVASAGLGAILALYGVIGLAARQFRVPARAEPWLSPLVGLVTGLVTGATGVFVVPAVPYLGSLGLAKEQLIQALGLSFTVSTVALAAALALQGSYQLPASGSSALAVLPALAGMFLGQRVRATLRPDVFRRWFFVGLIVLGIYMLVRAVS
ncbi:sulfite exporter TauE/SafE family protein [Rhodoferax saidenbachensis]|uniref:Probable membrane transporter protein n=1 Tax=Rhodoferax saidenbachensis TaxID=1484693 RepID=A0A1P8KB75_9BURK|nr:sulfite exporter TauE/SafE family protein [Rhodoferax saidenbachensis]APW43259.1 anion permease [Rhodoferax saidenbachensis]